MVSSVDCFLICDVLKFFHFFYCFFSLRPNSHAVVDLVTSNSSIVEARQEQSQDHGLVLIFGVNINSDACPLILVSSISCLLCNPLSASNRPSVCLFLEGSPSIPIPLRLPIPPHNHKQSGQPFTVHSFGLLACFFLFFSLIYRPFYLSCLSVCRSPWTFRISISSLNHINTSSLFRRRLSLPRTPTPQPRTITTEHLLL